MLLSLTLLRMILNSKHGAKKKKSKKPKKQNTERKKPSFPKELVENVDLNKFILKKQ